MQSQVCRVNGGGGGGGAANSPGAAFIVQHKRGGVTTKVICLRKLFSFFLPLMGETGERWAETKEQHSDVAIFKTCEEGQAEEMPPSVDLLAVKQPGEDLTGWDVIFDVRKNQFLKACSKRKRAPPTRRCRLLGCRDSGGHPKAVGFLSNQMWQNVFSSTGDVSSHVGRVLRLLRRVIFKVPRHISLLLFMLTRLSTPCWDLFFCANLRPGSGAFILKLDWKAAFWSGLVLASPFVTALWLGVVLLITQPSSAAGCLLGIRSDLWDPLGRQIYSHRWLLCQWTMSVVFLCLE